MADKLIPVEIFDDNAEITITLTNTMHKRIQELMFKCLPFKDYKHFLLVTKQIQNGEASTDPLAYHLTTCLMLTSLFEKGAKEQGKITKKAFNLTTKKVEDLA